ncbi:XRE family transcriptional regulator [Saccharothrix isguenensis]
MPRRETPLASEGTVLLSFAGDLRRLRDKAGRPTYRELGRRANYSAAALSAATAGRKLPSLAVTLAFVRACGGDVDEWRARWSGIAAADAPPSIPGDTPYVGLASFQTGDADRFFGREALTATLVDLVRRRRFTGVFGASGSGKSSLLRAGLAARSDDPVVIITPGRDPVEECAVALAGLTGESPVAVKADLAAAPGNLHLWIRKAMAERDLLLVVDQFEEVFTQCAAADREWLVRALTLAANADNSRVRVVIGVRADFYGHCGRHPELPPALHGSQVLVGPMSADELRLAITGPAAGAGATVETALVVRLVADVTGRASALPLVSHALVETWLRRRGMTLSLAGYEQAGGVEHAIARTAEEVFGALSPGGRRDARSVLLRLIALGDGTEDTRRRVRRHELEVDQALLDRLARARLITLDDDTVELTHEALIQAWPRLRGWIAHDRDVLRRHRELTDAVDTWEAHGRDPDGLYRGARLEQARVLRDRLSSREQDFLDASEAAENSRHAVERRRTRRLKQYVALLVGLAVVLAGTAGYAAVAENSADLQRNSALSLRAADAALRLLPDRPGDAVRLALTAYRVSPTAEALNAVRVAWAGMNAAELILRPPWRRLSVAPEGDVAISTEPEARSFTVWQVEVDDGTARRRADVPAEGRVALISGDSGVFLLESDRGPTRVWSIADPDEPRLVATLQQVIVQTMSRSGSVLAGVGERHEPQRFDHPENVLSGTGVASLWRWGDDGAVTEVRLPGERVESVALRGDGRVAATVRLGPDYLQRYVELWHVDPAGPVTPAGPLLIEEGQVRAVFSPDGRALAVVNETTKIVDVLDVADPSAPRHVAHLEDLPLSEPTVGFAADNRALLIHGRPELVQVWDITAPGAPRQVASIEGHPATVDFSRYRPDERELVVSDQQGDLLRFDLDDRRLLADTCEWRGADEDRVDWARYFPGVPRQRLCP